MGGSAFLFPGHGTQRAGMGRSLYDSNRSFRSLIDSLARYDGNPYGGAISFLLAGREGDPAISATGGDCDGELTGQLAIYLLNAGYDMALREKDIQPAHAYGYSSGIYSAVACSGAISFEEGLRLTGWAWEAMIATLTDRPTGMITVTGLRPDLIETLLADQLTAGEVSVANINSERQVYLSGYRDSLTEAMGVLRQPGLLNMQWLTVSIPYHSALIARAADAFSTRVASVTLTDAVIPLIDGCTGQLVQSRADIGSLLRSQLVQQVNVPACCDRLHQLNPSTLWEVGGGSFLQRLFRFNRRLPDVVSAEAFLSSIATS